MHTFVYTLISMTPFKVAKRYHIYTHLPTDRVSRSNTCRSRVQRQMQKNGRIKIKTRQRQILILSVLRVCVCVCQCLCICVCVCLLQSFALWIEMSFYLHMRIVAYETHSQIFATPFGFASALQCKKTLKKVKCLPQSHLFRFLPRYHVIGRNYFRISIASLLHVHWKLLFPYIFIWHINFHKIRKSA